MLYELIKAMYRVRSEYIKTNYYEPEMTVTFSCVGFNEVRACTDAQRYLINPNILPDAICGYPFSVDPHQSEHFKIVVRNKHDHTLYAIICGSPNLVTVKRGFK